MKKLFLSLCAATLMFAGCEPEDITYTYEDMSFHYGPEYTITEETPLSNGVHVVLKGEGGVVMYADILKPGNGIENESWEAKEAFVKSEADKVMRVFQEDPAYEWTWEPIPNTSKHDRWSPDDEIPTSTWNMILLKRNGEPLSMAIYVQLYRNYEVRIICEGPTEDERGKMVWIANTMHLNKE